MKSKGRPPSLQVDDGADDGSLVAAAAGDGEMLLRLPQPTIRPPPLRLEHKNDTDCGDSDGDGLETDRDALEASCDIGETSLKKGPIRINRLGVTFVEDDAMAEAEAKANAACDLEDSGSRPSSRTSSRSSSPVRPPLPLSSRPVVSLDDLETCGLLGRGCSGHVVKARHRDTQQLFAVKVVNNVYDKAKRDQMLTEIRTLYSVESPFLVDFYGAYFQDHQLSLVLEFCDVGSLDAVIQRRAPMPERIVAAMASQMLHGLLHLKQTHHFHRDIKPQNILVRADGKVKLTDFGLARELGHSQDMAQTFVGTFKYMSPERVQNEPYNYKSDIWSIGLVLIECATKMFPFRNARSYIDVVQSIIECTEPELPADTATLSFTDEFRDFISDCLKKEPKKRGSVDKLLSAPWLQRHQATDGARCARRIADWLQGREECEAKHGTASTSDEEDEIEEDIQAVDDGCKDAK
ncbi:hypothetical protein P43SY_006724 [Pythium insidiosum]|uniref:mitogen-activated protein kinase kinase n=1 Tax=Pythium insidiosum TaxID=114742 RepID=A0AAD5QEN5_PYTIN|nr:hypothetical protein P43SY_006724 [Pythium insidiosum]